MSPHDVTGPRVTRAIYAAAAEADRQGMEAEQQGDGPWARKMYELAEDIRKLVRGACPTCSREVAEKRHDP